MNNDMVLDRTKAEFRLLGRRHAVIDVQSLCDHLDTLVGVVVAEVIMSNLETRCGKEDGAKLRAVHPKASVDELVKMLAELDRVTGMGVTKAEVKETVDIMRIEVWNPVVRGEKGAAKSFLFSWWCGALSSILGKELEVRSVQYDEKANVMKCEISPRQVT